MRYLTALGQTQKSEGATGKSALPSTAGIVSQTCQDREVPAAERSHHCRRQSCFSLKSSPQTLLDMLEVPQHGRTAGAYRRLAKLMAELGWTAVRVRDLTRGGYKEQVRGYVRDGRPAFSAA